MPRLNLNNRLSGPGSVLKLDIQMRDLHHEVSRTILVPKQSTFSELHMVIQGAFMWRNCHSWTFETVDEARIENVDLGLGKALKPSDTKLSRFLKAVGDPVLYTYDWGDEWQHVVRVEEILDPQPGLVYPHCTAAKRKGPPEDGSSPGYENLCKVLKKSPRARKGADNDLIEWLDERYGGGYGNPEEFKPEDCKFEFEVTQSFDF